MTKSILGLLILCAIWGIFAYSYEFLHGLIIKPLNKIKRKLLVNMTKRKSFLSISKFKSLHVEEDKKSKKQDKKDKKNKKNKSKNNDTLDNSTTNKDNNLDSNETFEDGIERDNNTMKKASNLVIRFRLFYIVMLVILLIATSTIFVEFLLDLDDIIILAAFSCIIFLIAKFHYSWLNEKFENKYVIRLLKIDKEYMDKMDIK